MENKRTCLYDKHVALGALISPFGGFDMPIQYSNIVDEHNAVRQACGVFDVSHMGEVLVTGPESEKFVNYIFTNDVTGAPDGKIYYGMMCHPTGGVVDDLLVYKMAPQRYFLSCVVLTKADIAAIEQLEQEYYDDSFIYGNNPAASLSKVERIEGVGEFHVSVDVKENRIRKVSLAGDFFIVAELDSMLLDRLKGVEYTRVAIEEVLAGVDTSAVIMNLKREQLVNLLI